MRITSWVVRDRVFLCLCVMREAEEDLFLTELNSLILSPAYLQGVWRQYGMTMDHETAKQSDRPIPGLTCFFNKKASKP